MDVIDLENTTKKIIVGRLNSSVISALNLGINETNIILWYDRVTYFRKHQNLYTSEAEFISCINQIPDVIANPDYVAKRPNTGSIDYIKRIDKLFIVAVRIKSGKDIFVRAAYPLSEEQLSAYILYGSAKKMK